MSKWRRHAANAGDEVIPSIGSAEIPRRSAARNDTVGWTALALASVSSTAYAQSPAAEGPSLLPLILTLIFVLALIPVAVWMLKRLGAGSPASALGLKIVGQLSLGQRERLVVVEAGDRWLVLGVTGSSINRVGTLPKGELPPGSAPAPFAVLLTHMRKGRDNG